MLQAGWSLYGPPRADAAIESAAWPAGLCASYLTRAFVDFHGRR